MARLLCLCGELMKRLHFIVATLGVFKVVLAGLVVTHDIANKPLTRYELELLLREVA